MSKPCNPKATIRYLKAKLKVEESSRCSYFDLWQAEERKVEALEAKLKALHASVDERRLEIVRQITNAGGQVVESMTRALLSYDKNL